MITISRPSDEPESLRNPRIKEYLDALANYHENPEANPQPKPPIDYRHSDLLEVFQYHFHSKCYLTERKFDSAWDLEIDHFEPRVEAPHRIYDWTNLFPIDPKANRMKPKRTPEGGYLNPCDPADNVEQAIIYSIGLEGDDLVFVARDRENVKAQNTARLLTRVHNGHDPESRKSVEGLKIAIRRRYIEVLKEIGIMNYHPDEATRALSAEILRGYLSKRSSFTMLLRSSPPVNLLGEEFFVD